MDEEAKQAGFDLDVETKAPESKSKKSKASPAHRNIVARQGDLSLVSNKPTVATAEGEVRLAIDVLAEKESIFDAIAKLYKLSKINDPAKRNQAYVEFAMENLVIPFWGDLPDKVNPDMLTEDLRTVDVNRKHALLIGMGAGIKANGYRFTDSAALGQNDFRFAQDGETFGALVIGDYAYHGSAKIEHDNHGKLIEKKANIIRNSFIFGQRIFGESRNDEVSDSILAGSQVAENAFNLSITNSWIVTENEKIYVNKYRLSGRKGINEIPGIRTPLKV